MCYYNAMSEERGRPTIYDDAIVGKLIAAFHDGLNITQACWEAGINRDTYYEWLDSQPGFSDKMEQAQNEPSLIARRVVIKAMHNNDEKVARWWLERKNKDEFSARQEVVPFDPEKVEKELKALEEANNVAREAKKQVVALNQSLQDQGQAGESGDVRAESAPVEPLS